MQNFDLLVNPTVHCAVCTICCRATSILATQCCIPLFITWMVLGILSWPWYHFLGIGMVFMCMWKHLSCHCYFNSYAIWMFTKRFFLTPWVSTLDSQLLCCDLIAEMHYTNTVTIDIGIGLFSMLRFNFIHVCNNFTFLCYHRLVSKISLWFWMLCHIFWSVCRHL